MHARRWPSCLSLPVSVLPVLTGARPRVALLPVLTGVRPVCPYRCTPAGGPPAYPRRCPSCRSLPVHARGWPSCPSSPVSLLPVLTGACPRVALLPVLTGARPRVALLPVLALQPAVELLLPELAEPRIARAVRLGAQREVVVVEVDDRRRVELDGDAAGRQVADVLNDIRSVRPAVAANTRPINYFSDTKRDRSVKLSQYTNFTK